MTEELDEILGITRCVRCGQRLDGEVECPVCSGYYDSKPSKGKTPKWVYLTACFLTSPLSLYFIMRSTRLTDAEKLLASSGCLLWGVVGALAFF